jgi:hypothetical protein
MGYRSQVVIVIAAELKVPAEVEAALTEVFGQPSAESRNGDRLYDEGYIKWYNDIPDDDYKDIATIHNFISSLSSEDDEYVLFQRLGEDVSDYDEMGNMYDNSFGTELVRQVRWSNPDPAAPRVVCKEPDKISETC